MWIESSFHCVSEERLNLCHVAPLDQYRLLINQSILLTIMPKSNVVPLNLSRSEGTLRAMHDITISPDLGFTQQVRRILSVGAQQLGFPLGLVSRQVAGRLRAEYVGNPENGFSEGSMYEICDSFCGHVYSVGEMLGIHDATVPPWDEHPGCTKLGIQSYIGMPIEVLGQTWGTVCFFSETPRPEEFSSADYELLNLIGQRIQIGIEREALQDRFRAALAGISRVVGDKFLRTMVSKLSDTLGADMVFVAQSSEDTSQTARTLAVWNNGSFADELNNIEFEVPKEMMTDWEQSSFESNSPLSQPITLFGSEYKGFMGVPIRGCGGKLHGYLGAVSKNDLLLHAYDQWLIELFSARAGGELARLRHEEEQREMERVLQHSDKLKSLGILAGGVAHDLNNLFTSVIGNASLIKQRSASLDAKINSWANQLEQSVIRASTLTMGLLAYAGRKPLQTGSLDLNDVVRDLPDLLGSALSSNAQLEMSLSESLPHIDADLAQVQQVVLNLLMNASDALQGNSGRITVRTGLCDLSEKDLKAFIARDSLKCGLYVYLDVEDTGVGMDENTMKLMFEPFFSTKTSGGGLGLSAALGIASSHNAGFKVRSELGHGTQTRIVFPARERRLGQWPVGNSSKNISSTILVVDDEAMIRTVASEMLEQLGLNVVTAANGEDALARLQSQEDIDTVLLDLTMPGMDGRAVALAIQNLQIDVPIVLMSGYDKSEATAEFPNVRSFLQKPFMLEHLIDAFADEIDKLNVRAKTGMH